MINPIMRKGKRYELKSELSLFFLKLREDSKLCKNYINNTSDFTLKQTVATMLFFDSFYYMGELCKTYYRKFKERLISLKDEDVYEFIKYRIKVISRQPSMETQSCEPGRYYLK